MVSSTLTFLTRDQHLIARGDPGPGSAALDDEALRVQIADAGYGDWFLFDDALTTLISRWNSAEGELELTEGELELTVGERRDGQVEIEIAVDAMSAKVTISPAYGGVKVSPTEVYLALGAADVAYGLDEPTIREACVAGTATVFVGARGTLPIDGADTRFETLIQGTRDRAPHPDEKGLVDFRELGAIPIVEANQALMRRIPPGPGQDGRTVLGEILLSTPGKNLAFTENLTGACVAATDTNLLVAIFKGQPVLAGNGVCVEPVLQIENVNMTSGNISFDGTVLIMNEVLPGMKVHATGDIIVGGTVDAAELDAGGNIQISGGVIAHAHVKAKGSVAAKFVENANISAGTVIAIEGVSLESELLAMNQILIGTKAQRKGLLAGGTAHAMLRIATPILGAENSGVTHLVVGVNPTLDARHHELLERITKQQADEANLQKLIGYLTAHADKKEMLERAQATWERAAQNWVGLLSEKDELEKQLELVKGAVVEMSVGVQGPIDLAFGKKAKRFRQKTLAGSFVVIGDRIELTDPSGEVLSFG